MQRSTQIGCQATNLRIMKPNAMRFSWLAAVSLCTLLVSCSKDSANSFGGAKLLRILVGSAVNSEFSYDAGGHLIKYTNYFQPGSALRASESIRHYDDMGKLVKTENAINISSSTTHEQMDSSYAEFSYGPNNMISETRTFRRINGINGPVRNVSKAINEYDSQNRLIAVTLYDTTNKAYAKSTYQYNAQDNIVMQELFQYNSSPQGPTTRYTYEYDSKSNPYKDIWVMPYGANRNNITKQVVTNLITPSTTTGITVFKSYGSNGYPTLVNENGADYVYEYK
jgi:hypothetical protein